MLENKARIFLFGLVALFSALLFLFRRRIAYPFCPLEKYTGKIGKGKSQNLLIVHILLSSGSCLFTYSLLDSLALFEAAFDNTVIRISTLLILWLFWISVLGWLIELYLEATDKKYKGWKAERLRKDSR